MYRIASGWQQRQRRQLSGGRRRIWFVNELPKGPTGKILKRDIAIPSPARTET